jgi:hypothetical protein
MFCLSLPRKFDLELVMAGGFLWVELGGVNVNSFGNFPPEKTLKETLMTTVNLHSPSFLGNDTIRNFR